MVKVTLIKSPCHVLANQKANLEALGLHKIGNSNTFENSPALQGKLKKVSHLVKVEEI